MNCSLCYGSGWIPGVAYPDRPLDEMPCPDCRKCERCHEGRPLIGGTVCGYVCRACSIELAHGFLIWPHDACQARGCEACAYTGCRDAVAAAEEER